MELDPHTDPTQASRSEGLREVLATARSLVAFEAQRSERLEGKARTQLYFAVLWFGFAQVVFVISLAHTVAGDEFRWLTDIAAVCFALSVVVLVVLLWTSREVWRLRTEFDNSPNAILQMGHAVENDREDQGLPLLVQNQAAALDRRRRSNDERAEALEGAQRIWIPALALPLLELTTALAALWLR